MPSRPKPRPGSREPLSLGTMPLPSSRSTMMPMAKILNRVPKPSRSLQIKSMSTISRPAAMEACP